MQASKYFVRIFLIQMVFAQLFMARATYSQDLRQVKLSLHLTSVSIEDVLQAMEKETDFVFAYSEELNRQVTQPFTLTYHNVSLQQVLDDLTVRAQLQFRVINKTISVVPTLSAGHAQTACDSLASRWMHVQGVVREPNGQPLPGVSITIKGTNRGTVSDHRGRFVLQAAPQHTILFSFIGYQTTEQVVQGRNTLDVTLREATLPLKEVVVLGYGEQPRRDLTGAVSTVHLNDVKEMPVVGMDQLVQGRAAGVTVVNNTGEPGGGVTMRIRGASTLGIGSDPLFVIDGIPLDNEETFNRNVGEARINGLSQINPADIASMEVLKDAASTAIYGARASNGVVMITTKRGHKGPPQLNVEAYTGLARMAHRYHMLEASDFAAFANEGLASVGKDPVFTEEMMAHPAYNTNWQDLIFRHAMVANTNVAIHGGNETTRYRVSAGYLDQQGVIIDTDFKRYALRANLDHQLSNRVSVGINLYTSVTEQARAKNEGGADVNSANNLNNLYGPPVLTSALVASPYQPVYDQNGYYHVDTLQLGYVNPLRQARKVDINTSITRMLPSLFIHATPVPHLTFTSRFSADVRDEMEDWWNPPDPNRALGADGTGQVSQRTYGLKMWAFDNYVTYEALRLHAQHLSIMLGTSQQRSQNRSSFVLVSGVVTPQVRTLNAGIDADVVTSDKQAWSLASFFSRINYDLKERYLLTINGCYNGSSRFGKNNRWGFFPSVSLGWRLSDEEFMQPLQKAGEVKLRASWGITGNQYVGNYASRSLFNFGTGAAMGNNYTDQIGAKFATLASPNLGWEETIQTDIGIDMALLNNRLQLTLDYYIKETKGLLFTIPLPTMFGFSGMTGNVGRIENKGLEVSLQTINLTSHAFHWTTSFTLATNQNKVKSLLVHRDVVVGTKNTGFSIAREGHPVSFYLYQREKYVDPETGDVVIRDNDHDGGITSGDLTLTGSPFPDYFGGVNNVFLFRRFDLSMFLQFSYGNDVYNVTRRGLELFTASDLSVVGANTTRKAFANHWQQPGDRTTYPRVNYETSSNRHLLVHDGWLENASYLRLKTLTLGYDMTPWLHTAHVSQARIYFSANNLLTFTRYRGYDPEVNHYTGGLEDGTNSGLLQGYDNGTYPQAQTMIVGVNLTF